MEPKNQEVLDRPSIEVSIQSGLKSEKCVICDKVLDEHEYPDLKACFKKQKLIGDIVYMRMCLRKNEEMKEVNP